jgi:hypothetical protein
MYKRTGPVNKETQDDLRAAAILPVFALKKNFEFGWKPPVHILDNNAVSIGTTLQPAGLEASKGVISVNYSKDPLDPSWQDTPGTKKYFDFMAKYYADGDAQPTGAGLQERRIRRPTSELWFRVGRLFHRPTIFALSAATSRRGVGPDPALTGWS